MRGFIQSALVPLLPLFGSNTFARFAKMKFKPWLQRKAATAISSSWISVIFPDRITGNAHCFHLMLQAKNELLIGWNTIQFFDSHLPIVVVVVAVFWLYCSEVSCSLLVNEQWKIYTTKVVWLLTGKPLTWLKFEWIWHQAHWQTCQPMQLFQNLFLSSSISGFSPNLDELIIWATSMEEFCSVVIDFAFNTVCYIKKAIYVIQLEKAFYIFFEKSSFFHTHKR